MQPLTSDTTSHTSVSDVARAPESHPRAGEKIRTDYWRKPGPTNAFDWSATFDNDEPNDDGQMSVGYGATEQDAIEDLLISTDE